MVLLTTTKQFDILRTNDLQQLILTSVFAILTGVGAFIVIPLSFSPVPITFQTAFVILAGFVLGRYYGPLSQIIYVLLGIMGVPWFSGGKFGLSVLFGATGGYLVGFIVSAYVVGWLTDISKETRTPLALFTTAVIGNLLVYIFGIIGLLNYANLWNALELGMFPFIPGDLFKILLIFGLLYFIYPSSDQTFDTGLTETKSKLWSLLLFTVSLGTFLIFFIYLYSNGNNIPIYLPEISVFASLCLLPSLYLFVKLIRKSPNTV